MSKDLLLGSEALRLEITAVRVEPERVSEEEIGPFEVAAVLSHLLNVLGRDFV